MTRPRGALWDAPEVVAWIVLNALAAGVVVIGYVLTAGKLTVESQVAGANVAVVGLLLSGFANAHWLVRGWRRIRVVTHNLPTPAQSRGDGVQLGDA
jgi:hypothetical protein